MLTIHGLLAMANINGAFSKSDIKNHLWELEDQLLSIIKRLGLRP